MKNCEEKTSLYGSETAEKSHPQIMLRGELDSLLARAVYTCALAKERGESVLQEKLADIVRVIKTLMGCEACGREADVGRIIGLTFDELREYSYHPAQKLRTEHYFPDEDTDLMTAALNLLRTDVRRAERFCIAAGLDGEANRSIQKVLNRLSSAVYILMLEHHV